MKGKIIGIIICWMLIITIIPFTFADNTAPNTIYVDDDAPEEWYDATHVKTIQEGIDAALEGDTIFIYNGIYEPSTNIHVNKPLIITGETKENVIIQHEIGSEELSIRAKNVEISTITFRNFGITNQWQYDNTIITDNIFIIDNVEKHWNPEVIFICGENIEISRNTMTFTGDYRGMGNPTVGICMQCYQSKIVDNIFTGMGSGTIAINIHDNSFWFHDFLNGKNIIEGNTFKNNRWGIIIVPTLKKGYNSEIVRNNFIGNEVNAMFIVYIPSTADFIRNGVEIIKNKDEYPHDFKLGLSALFPGYWNENYWDDYDGTGPMIIKGSIQTPGLISQLFHYVLPWINLDQSPASGPY